MRRITGCLYAVPTRIIHQLNADYAPGTYVNMRRRHNDLNQVEHQVGIDWVIICRKADHSEAGEGRSISERPIVTQSIPTWCSTWIRSLCLLLMFTNVP